MRLKLIVDNKNPTKTTLAVERDGQIIGIIPGVQHVAWSQAADSTMALTTITFSNLRIDGAEEE